VAHHLVYVRGTSHADARVWIADADGTNPRNLTQGFLGALSPDGKTVAVAREGAIYLVSSDGKRERRLLSGTGQPLRWTPDGKSLIVGTATSLALVDRTDGQTRTIARGPIYGFDFSPDGDEIVYSRAPHKTDVGICGDQFDLYVEKLDGGTPKQLTHEGLSAFPAWGPSRIAYSRFPGGTLADCSAPGIWTINPDGSDPTPIIEQAPPELTMLGYYGLQPISWLGDDKLLVGARTEYGTEGGVVNIGTGHLRRLHSYVVRPSSDARFYVGGSGADDQVVAITRIGDGRRVVVVKNACCPDWNR
jgi:dipeptidyl aminopeptidase/acylaminoacyl peptidase